MYHITYIPHINSSSLRIYPLRNVFVERDLYRQYLQIKRVVTITIEGYIHLHHTYIIY